MECSGVVVRRLRLITLCKVMNKMLSVWRSERENTRLVCGLCWRSSSLDLRPGTFWNSGMFLNVPESSGSFWMFFGTSGRNRVEAVDA